jgi:predicted porin
LGSISGPNALGYRGTAAFNNVEINAKYQFTPALLADIAMAQITGLTASATDTQVSLRLGMRHKF